MRMRHWQKVGILLVAAMMLMSLASCAQQTTPPPSTDTPTPAPQPETPAAPEPTQVLSITIDTTQDREPEMQAVAADLRKIGVEAEVRVWEKTNLLEEIKAGNRVMYVQDWGSSTFSPFDLAIPKLKTGDRGNYSFYSNPQVDALFDKGAFGASESERLDAYMQAQKLIHADAPWLFGYYLDSVEAASGKVSGFIPAMDSRINLHDVSLQGGDTIVVGLRTNSLQSMDPHNHRDRETETVMRNMYDGLVTRLPDGTVVPELAEKIDISDDGTVYTFHLRRGVKFHDGTEMTAADVVFTFNRIMAPDGIDGQQSPRLGLLGPLKSVAQVDGYTVQMTLDKAQPGVFLQLLVHHQVVPKAYVTRVGAQGLQDKPVGTGPFKFVRGAVDSEIVLERWDGYWGGPPDAPPVGPAQVRRAIFRMLPDPAARVAALKAGEVHIIQQVPIDSIAGLQSGGDLQVLTAQGTRLYMVEINNQKVTDPRIRQALNHAVNWDAITGALYAGLAHRVPTALLPSGFGYDTALQPYEYNPDKARQLLREAGYKTSQ